MHEMSIAREVCRIAAERVGGHRCGRIVGVGIDVGRESGIEPDNLSFWLEEFLAVPPFSGARPHIQLKEGSILQVSYLEVDDGDPPD